MARIILLIAIALAAYMVWQRLQKTAGPARKKMLWQLAAIVGALVLLLLVATGRLHWIGAALAAVLAGLKRWLPLALPYLQHLRKKPASASSAPPGGQSSGVDTQTLSMHLDHDSGQLSGTVNSGRWQGYKLEQMGEHELLDLYHHCCQFDVDAARLLENFLEQQLGANWRERQHQENRSAGGEMVHDEALAILGLNAGASREDILQAHRKLMQKLHPDRGGNDYLAAQLNQARDTLLS